ncbi:MAG TPA: SDR family NAD(P)-dependent oxidoreductase [Kiritimatiellia bacterium]|nr:SDR family NAD(P)-dependent oxidoreductase [Kiritimatiellia bacterium]HMP33717.1 SDR family NAD(P)-dependent oxidoreductase [Kiritimatiellia bacterium]
MNVLIAGCGYVGVRAAALLHAQGHAVWALRRSPGDPLPFLRWVQGDLTAGTRLNLPDAIDAVILAAGLRRDTDDRYQALLVDGYGRLLHTLYGRALPPGRCVMVSTTGVFAEADGGRVTEASPVDGDRSPARYYLGGEALVDALTGRHAVVRLSGIYGPERHRLIREVREGRAVRIPPPPHFLNQIHAADAAGALVHVLHLDTPSACYIASDTEPADRNDVLAWLADQLGTGPLPLSKDPADRPGRRSGNKRCDSAQLVASGYTFRYPTYREGYRALLREA